MHYTSKKAGEYFADLYGKDNYVVVDIGGADGHSTFRKYYTNLKMKYTCFIMVTVLAKRVLDMPS